MEDCSGLVGYAAALESNGASCNAGAASSPVIQAIDTYMQKYFQYPDKALGGCPYQSLSATICTDSYM